MSVLVRVSPWQKKTATKDFNRSEWLSEAVGEALNVYKTEGQEAILAIIQDLLTNTSKETKKVLIYTLMQLAYVDGDFTDRELDVLYRMVELLDVSRKDLVMIGMMYATKSQPKV